MENKLTHFNQKGEAVMVDVSGKEVTERVAVAEGSIKVSQEVYKQIEAGGMKKGDVLGVARIAGIMAAKKTGELIPLCHPLMLTSIEIDFEMDPEDCLITAFCTCRLSGKTGVEMEALTGVSITLLTIYDMCKALDKSMEIRQVHLKEKSGGKSGDYKRS